jgi:predicted transposase YbfD/YdcC
MLKSKELLQFRLTKEQCLKVRQSILIFFQNVPDPRASDNCKHSFTNLIFMMLMAVFSGAENIDDIHDYVTCKQHQLKSVLGEFNPPSYNTFWWILTRTDPEALATAFYKCEKGLQGEQICIDGKTSRGTLGKTGRSNLHTVHAYAHKLGLLIGQEKVSEKSNEITAIPALLDQLDIEDATVTMDAAGCQKTILDKISEGGGHFVIALKKNQRRFYDGVTGLFEEARKQGFEYVLNCDFHESIEKKSGRIEKRSIAIISDPSEVEVSAEWPDVETFIEVTRETTCKGKTSIERRYYISDLIESAREFGEKIRAHWDVEGFHWLLDVIFKDDDSRANMLHAGENLGILRKVAINLVKKTPHLKKKGMAKIRRQAMWSEDDALIKEICEALFCVKFV